MKALVDRAKFKELGALEAWLRWQRPRGAWRSPAASVPSLGPADGDASPGQGGQPWSWLTMEGLVSHMPFLPSAHSLPPYKINNYNNKIIIRRCEKMDYNVVFVILS